MILLKRNAFSLNRTSKGKPFRVLISLLITLFLLGSQCYAVGVSVRNEAVNYDGNMVSYSATVTNTGVSGNITPIMVIARYENDKLSSVNVYSETILAGEDKAFEVSMDYTNIGDKTQISGFVLDGAEYSIPVAYTLIEKEGNSNTVLSSMTIAGYDAEVDEENKIVKAFVPVFDNAGIFTDLETALPVTVTLADARSDAKFETTTLDGEANSADRTGQVVVSGDSKVTITSEDGHEAEYKLALYRIFADDFDNNSLFGGVSTGSKQTSDSGAGTYTWDGSFKITGADAINVFRYGGMSNSYYGAQAVAEMKRLAAQNVSVGVADISGARTRDGVNMPNGTDANASGNALELSKKIAMVKETAPGVYDYNSNSYYSEFIIGSFESDITKQLPGLKNASELVFEFDMAGDYWTDVPLTYDFKSSDSAESISINNRVGGAYVGLRAMCSNEEYDFVTIANSASDRRDGQNGVNINDRVLVSGTQGTNTTAGPAMYFNSQSDIEQWNHIKLEYRKREDGKCDAFINGLPINAKDASKPDNTPIIRSGIPTQFVFLTRGKSASNLWIDNIKITYSVD